MGPCQKARDAGFRGRPADFANGIPRFSRHTLWIGRGRAGSWPDAVPVVRHGPLELSGSAGLGSRGIYPAGTPATRGAPEHGPGTRVLTVRLSKLVMVA